MEESSNLSDTIEGKYQNMQKLYERIIRENIPEHFGEKTEDGGLGQDWQMATIVSNRENVR